MFGKISYHFFHERKIILKLILKILTGIKHIHTYLDLLSPFHDLVRKVSNIILIWPHNLP